MITTKTRGPGLLYQTFDQVSTITQSPIAVTTCVGGERYSTTQDSIPGYHRLKRLKVMLPATYFYQNEWHLKRSGFYSYGGPYGGGTNTSYYPGPHPGYGPYFNWDVDEALVNGLVTSVDVDSLLQQAVSNFSAEFDGLTFLAELHQVPGMLLGVLNRCADLLRRYFTGKGRIEGTASSYLEVRYGWLPLVSDLRSIQEVIDSYNKQMSEFIRHRSRFGLEDTSLQSLKSSPLSAGGCTWCFQLQKTCRVAVSGLGSATSRIRPVKVQCDPISTAWELVPYSFVIDWVLGVGRALNALRNHIIHFDMITHTGLFVNILVQSSTTATDITSGFHDLVCDSKYIEYRTYRTPKAVPLLPSLHINVSWLNCLDALMLAVQRIISVIGAKK